MTAWLLSLAGGFLGAGWFHLLRRAILEARSITLSRPGPDVDGVVVLSGKGRRAVADRLVAEGWIRRG